MTVDPKALDCIEAETGLTIKAYLKALLLKLWEERDAFSGKRPFGSSNWNCDLYAALVRGGYISGSFDEFGYLDACDSDAGDLCIAGLIELIFQDSQS